MMRGNLVATPNFTGGPELQACHAFDAKGLLRCECQPIAQIRLLRQGGMTQRRSWRCWMRAA